MIIVTGATGQLGRAVAEQLLVRLPAAEIGVSVREPQKAGALAERGVRVRHGDFGDAESLRHAFEGATQVLIVSSNSAGDGAVRQHQTAIDAARAAGARRILYTSHMGAGAASAFPPMRDHAATEALLQASGVAFTSLRNGFYADSGLMLMGPAAQKTGTPTGELVAPSDGPVSWTTHADLAEATALILADEGRLGGVTPPLTGAEALDLAALGALASALTGQPISRVLQSDDAYRSGMASRGLPAAQVEMLLGLFVASRGGEFMAVDGTLATLLGRPPVSMHEVLASRLTA
ncbi:NAD(P)H-binding protein [Deinococcus sp.]|uniref:NAD(P)H-binding protein n=1 Tax=Deinococcus sp. TaxID=47478 RepID=UPI003C7BAD5E